MKIIKLIALGLLALLMVSGGINHFLNPAYYDAFMPDFFPKTLANYAAGVVEIILGVGLIIPKWRTQAAWGILILMVIFLPLHIWDLFKDLPAVGSKQTALIRVPFQFLFIAWAYWHTRSAKQE